MSLWITRPLLRLVRKGQQLINRTYSANADSHNYANPSHNEPVDSTQFVMTQARSTLDALTQACRGLTQNLDEDDASMVAFQIVLILADGTTLVAQGENLGS